MNVAWAMLWGGSRSTKPCVFPCKVAGGDDERYLVCATVAAAVVPDAIGSSYGFCKNLCSCVRSSMRFLQLWLQIALEWLHECCMDYVVGRKPEHETLFFPCKVAGGDDERYSAAVAPAVVPDAIGSSYGFCKNLCSCVRSSMRFLKLWFQIALEWLHECCMGYVVGRKPEHETLCFSV